MALAAGRLRHRVRIESPVYTQNTTTGERVTTWATFADNVPAEIAPLSAREFIAAQATQSEIVARIVIRHRDGLTADMRIVHSRNVYERDSSGDFVRDTNGDKVLDHVVTAIYNPQGWLPDPDSGLEYVTSPVSSGVNDG